MFDPTNPNNIRHDLAVESREIDEQERWARMGVSPGDTLPVEPAPPMPPQPCDVCGHVCETSAIINPDNTQSRLCPDCWREWWHTGKPQI